MKKAKDLIPRETFEIYTRRSPAQTEKCLSALSARLKYCRIVKGVENCLWCYNRRLGRRVGGYTTDPRMIVRWEKSGEGTLVKVKIECWLHLPLLIAVCAIVLFFEILLVVLAAQRTEFGDLLPIIALAVIALFAPLVVIADAKSGMAAYGRRLKAAISEILRDE